MELLKEVLLFLSKDFLPLQFSSSLLSLLIQKLNNTLSALSSRSCLSVEKSKVWFSLLLDKKLEWTFSVFSFLFQLLNSHLSSFLYHLSRIASLKAESGEWKREETILVSLSTLLLKLQTNSSQIFQTFCSLSKFVEKVFTFLSCFLQPTKASHISQTGSQLACNLLDLLQMLTNNSGEKEGEEGGKKEGEEGGQRGKGGQSNFGDLLVTQMVEGKSMKREAFKISGQNGERVNERVKRVYNNEGRMNSLVALLCLDEFPTLGEKAKQFILSSSFRSLAFAQHSLLTIISLLSSNSEKPKERIVSCLHDLLTLSSSPHREHLFSLFVEHVFYCSSNNLTSFSSSIITLSHSILNTLSLRHLSWSEQSLDKFVKMVSKLVETNLSLNKTFENQQTPLLSLLYACFSSQELIQKESLRTRLESVVNGKRETLQKISTLSKSSSTKRICTNLLSFPSLSTFAHQHFKINDNSANTMNGKTANFSLGQFLNGHL